MVRPVFDDIIHVPVRLRVCAALEAAGEAEFAELELALGISTSLLSKHLKVLVDCGYVELDKRKQLVGRPRTFVRLTFAGQKAYHGHAVALKEMLGER